MVCCCAGLQANSDVDNLLLEWSLILELINSHKKLSLCLPVVVGRVGSENTTDNMHISELFKEGVIELLPEVVCLKVVAAATEALVEVGVTGSDKLPVRTVRGTVQELLLNLGYVVPAQSISGAHETETLERDLFVSIGSKVLCCIDSSQSVDTAQNQQLSLDISQPDPEEHQPSLYHDRAEIAQVGGGLEKKELQDWTASELSEFFQVCCNMKRVSELILHNMVDGKTFCSLSINEVQDLDKGLGLTMLQVKRVKAELEKLKVQIPECLIEIKVKPQKCVCIIC